MDGKLRTVQFPVGKGGLYLIRFGLLSADRIYMNRVAEYLSAYHGAMVSPVCFSSKEQLDDYEKENHLQLLLVEDGMLSPDKLPQDITAAYLVEESNIASKNGIPAIAKYQQMSQFYRAALQLYAKRAMPGVQFRDLEETDAPVVSFVSGAGGVGVTSVAAACARYFALDGKRCLYLNLEPYGITGDLMEDVGDSSLSDLLYEIKSRHALLPAKVEATLRRDRSGVFFFAPFREELDYNSMTADEMNTMIHGLFDAELFDVIVADVGAVTPILTASVLQASQRIVAVSDGSQIGNQKLERLLHMMRRLDAEQDDAAFLSRICLLYNRYGERSVSAEHLGDMECLGYLPYYENAVRRQVVEQLALEHIFARLLDREPARRKVN